MPLFLTGRSLKPARKSVLTTISGLVSPGPALLPFYIVAALPLFVSRTAGPGVTHEKCADYLLEP